MSTSIQTAKFLDQWQRELRAVSRIAFAPSPMRVIAEEVAQKHKLTLTHIRSSSSSRRFTCARREIAIRCQLELGAGPMAIGRLVNRDHTTVRHYLRGLRSA